MRRHVHGASRGAPFAHHATNPTTTTSPGARTRPHQRMVRPHGGSDGNVKKVVLAFTGGLDTSVAVAWLREHYDADVITVTVDVGGGSLREHVAQRAHAAGASKAYVVDGRDRFLRRFVFPSLQANALYQDAYPL